MPIKLLVATLSIGTALSAGPAFVQNAPRGPLAGVKSLRCLFPLVAVGSWGQERPQAVAKPAQLVLEFDQISSDEGTAEVKGGMGKADIVTRYAGGYLHFIQSFLNGPLYITTVFDKKTITGKLKAVHSRHEHTDVAVPGYTSTPEQYYGECEILE